MSEKGEALRKAMLSNQEIMEYYGRSVYSIQLELAMRLFCEGLNPEEAFSRAMEFVAALQRQGDE
jgi:hypothetical protein